MERNLWTDERLDDRFAMTDQRFEELIARLDRFDMRMERLEARLDDLYRQMNTFMIANFTALLSIAVLVIART